MATVKVNNAPTYTLELTYDEAFGLLGLLGATNHQLNVAIGVSKIYNVLSSAQGLSYVDAFGEYRRIRGEVESQ